jgi:hypothetical protein
MINPFDIRGQYKALLIYLPFCNSYLVLWLWQRQQLTFFPSLLDSNLSSGLDPVAVSTLDWLGSKS